MDVPVTRYARSGDVAIAYQVIGDGPFDLVWTPGAFSNVELTWEKPAQSTAPLERMGRRRRRRRSIGARIAAQAGPGEVLVSPTVKDLVAGSGISFRERGLAKWQGVSGEWQLFAVERV